MGKTKPPSGAHRSVIIGAGIGGLSAALRLAAAGCAVTVLERHAEVGGKMRQVSSPSGPVDAGPTVLTLRHVFEDLFAAAGERLDDHVTLIRQPVLARHWWPDGTQLDLFSDPDASAGEIGRVFGTASERDFRAFTARARRLFEAFERPMMRSASPRMGDLAATVLRKPRLIADMAPGRHLAGLLRSSFRDPRLQQLFGRYATYVGGSPYQSPALLSLIWRAEEAGVWTVEGGIHTIVRTLARLVRARGGEVRTGVSVAGIDSGGAGVTGVRLSSGEEVSADSAVFNGDPRALALGLVATTSASVSPELGWIPRSLSACVWSFAAEPEGPELLHHNVFFCADPGSEFDALHRGRLPSDPTFYVCAQDRGMDRPAPPRERFEIIMNAPPLVMRSNSEGDFEQCRTLTFDRLAARGLRFNPLPDRAALATPRTFETLFPGSAGSLYGQSPHGMTASLTRPRARTAIPGLYLAGGGAHPGAGVPMAALSGQHAAEAILTDLGST